MTRSGADITDADREGQARASGEAASMTREQPLNPRASAGGMLMDALGSLSGFVDHGDGTWSISAARKRGGATRYQPKAQRRKARKPSQRG